MRIAFISFEYPPDTAVGGIATYVNQVAKMMKSRGHDVEVFSASPTRAVSEEYEGLLVHRIHTNNTQAFPKLVLPVFEERHLKDKFDLIESPEYKGDGYEIKRRFSTLPMVVKLHTPTQFIHEINFTYNILLSGSQKLRYILGGLLRGEIRQPYWKQHIWKKDINDIDYQVTAIADQIHTPSISLGDHVSEKWGIPREKIFNVPYPFIPNEKFLEIPIAANPVTKKVTFIGRLEIRKGLVELTKAIPYVCEAVPDVTFTFVGKPIASIVPGMMMDEYIKKNLPGYESKLEFTQAIAPEIPKLLAQADVCVFPSIWENFPNVCLEAMSAGRAIVASKQGGMYDMLSSPEAGLLVDPMQPREIANAIIKLLKDPELRTSLGKAARHKVLQAYNQEKIGGVMEGYYNQLVLKTAR
ncbi:glycosyltransferase family 4 protein [Hymenobacter wooponensis]|uniref:Glycosyltransferase family 1 protein n=1 Tax=Hymenobacter wooponensis TaxID=1525360 RepID=A0A4Z0MTM7_9BACT|nr:glycosyltransferase family 4 protein [Hymenobacter wooponensis]TGD82994.1 glycosyltransferase family 1 protein [Hymenobacter wooponensis]